MRERPDPSTRAEAVPLDEGWGAHVAMTADDRDRIGHDPYMRDGGAIAVKTRWEQAAETTWGRYLTDAETRVLQRGLDLAPAEGEAMEVGCEGGRWSRQILDRRGSVICTDVDSETLELCRRRLPGARCVLTGAGATSLPAGDGELGFLLVYEVVPVTDAVWLPGEAARVLRHGGVCVFSHYNPASIRAIAHRTARVLGRRAEPESFYRGPSFKALKRSLEMEGFEFIHEEGLAWMPFPRESNSALIPSAVRIEAALGLRRRTALSPWVLGIIRRR